MKVYVLTSGEYSDYHIIGVLLDEEQAKIAAETMTTSRYDAVDVEEYDTDELKFIKPGWKYWTIAFSDYDHAIMGITCHDYFGSLDEPTRLGAHHKFWYVDVYAKDEDHAIKSASDKLNKYLAEKNGL